jgi:hypothetical protein
VNVVGEIYINTDFAEALEKHRTGNCDRCGKKAFLFDYEVWKYCEECCDDCSKVDE